MIWITNYMFKSNNFSLNLFKDTPKICPPLGFESQRLVGGEGGPKDLYFVHPHPSPPPSKGGGELVGKFQIKFSFFRFVPGSHPGLAQKPGPPGFKGSYMLISQKNQQEKSALGFSPQSRKGR
jgi:hypothetical protein